jgi:hypothetical protein
LGIDNPLDITTEKPNTTKRVSGNKGGCWAGVPDLEK